MVEIDHIVSGRERDLGGFSVRRILPYARQRMVGPFIFFDHMGPAEFPPGQGINVRPHPHINLATVTYLFEGKIHHRDSLGSDQMIEPGAINWMTAGRGIVHSERHPPDLVGKPVKLNGIQCWVALPAEYEEMEPRFSHHPKSSLPEFEAEGAKLRLLLGEALGRKSPVPVHSNLFYLDVELTQGARLDFPTENRELAVYLVDGRVEVEGKKLSKYDMAILTKAEAVTTVAQEPSRIMLLGGAPLGERFIYWNFVSSQKERIDEASQFWARGPRKDCPRFPPIPGDDQEWIPLPEVKDSNPKGTIM